ncbi:MAG: WYL domain-containing protein [Dehalococcoidia bacterium]|nr:WYL domain-containing protein [Dehalococcoidia bacterium]
MISFDYVNASGNKSSRSAEPVKLIFNAYTWYLIAYCFLRNSHRIFRLSRIRNVQITNQYFTRREMQDHENLATRAPLIDLQLRCDEQVLSRLYDTFDGDCISKNDNGSYDLAVTIPEDEWIYGYILSFGSNAEVLEPKHIREIIKIRAKEISEKY